MIRCSVVVLAALMTASLAAPGGLADPGPLEPTRYVVGFDAMPRDLEVGDSYNGATVVLVDHVLSFAAVVTQTPALFELQTSLDDNVVYMELDPEQHLVEFTPNDPSYSTQYGPQQVKANTAWDTTLGDMDAKVCIVDTGVRYTHQDLSGSRWLGGFDFVSNDADPWDDNGHGTHVAGSAAAGINNGVGIAGVANVGIYGVKVLNSAGSGSLSAVASGIRWCADNGGSRVVISLSLGSTTGATALQDAVSYAYTTKGALVVAAAGNDGPCSNCVNYPAKYTQAIAVTCTTATKAQCSFSSDGPESELAAPGNSIYSTWYTSNTAYATLSGTSMSTPHVSGVAALVWSHVTTLSNVQLRDYLRCSAEDLGTAGLDELFGYGLVDAKKTLDNALAGSCTGSPPPPPPGETTVYFENVDDGSANGWTKSSSSDLWHVEDGCVSDYTASYKLAWTRAGFCNYNTGARVTNWAKSGAISLAGKTQATLKFVHMFDIEQYAGGAYDKLLVQVSRDNVAWSTIKQWDSRNSDVMTWTAQSFDIDGYAGGNLYVRLYTDTVDSTSNGFPGWFVDNLEVTAS